MQISREPVVLDKQMSLFWNSFTDGDFEVEYGLTSPVNI